MTAAMAQRPTLKGLLAEYDSDQYGPLFAVSDEGSAGPIVLDAALSSAKAVAGASGPFRLGVILDGERMTSAGEVPIGPPEYGELSTGAAGQLLLTTNVGTRINVRLTGQLPEFPGVEKSAEAVIAAFHQFLDTPDSRPRPLTVRLQVDPGGDCTQLTALARKLDEARKKGQIGPADTHQLSVLVSFKEEIATDAQLEQIEAVIAAAAGLGFPEVAIDGAQLPYARRRWGAQGLLNVLSVPASNRLLKFATARGVRLGPRYQVDVNSAARTIWTGLEAARANGFDAGKYGLLPLTLEEQGQVIELITQWTSDWTAIPAFYVDTPLVTATEVIDVGQCEVAARRWLKVARGAGATTVLFDAPDRVNPRKLVHGSDSPDGVLTPDQIEALRDYSEVLGVEDSVVRRHHRAASFRSGTAARVWHFQYIEHRRENSCHSPVSTGSAAGSRKRADRVRSATHARDHSGWIPVQPNAQVARGPCPRIGNVHQEPGCERRRGRKVSSRAGDSERVAGARLATPYWCRRRHEV